MENNTILNKFKGECQVINFVYEYPGYTGDIKYGISTNLTEKELTEKYGVILDSYSPYILLNSSYGTIRRLFKRNEWKHNKRAERHIDFFNDDIDDELERFHPEIIGESMEETFFHNLENRTLYSALSKLTECQQQRISKYFFGGFTLEEIAAQEGVNYKAISCSIEAGLKKLKKILENTY